MRTARLGGLGDRQGIVEEDHHAVSREAFQRALVLEDELAHRLVVFAEHAHDLLGLRGLGKGGETAKVEEHDGDLAPVRPEGVLGAAGHDQLGELGREEALEPAEPLELGDLLLHPLLERAGEGGELVVQSA